MSELFVFGAGASHASGGTPLGKDLVWNFCRDCSKWNAVGPDLRPTEKDLEENRRDFIDFINFLPKIENRYPELSGISDKLDKAMEEGELASIDIRKGYYIDEIMEDLIRDRGYTDEVRLIKRIASQHISKTSHKSGNNFYKLFVKSLKDKTREEVAIISFNFDCLLEDDLRNGIYFDYLIEFDDIDSGRLYEPGRGIPLLKLHGSLDWRINTDTGLMTLLPVEWYKSYGGEPCIFLPHEQANQRTSQLLDEAIKFVRRTKKITFIGYSLPDYDAEDAKELFQSNIRNSTQIKVIDILEGSIDRYKKFFDKNIVDEIVCDLRKYGTVRFF